jgi:hypothetical protein
MAYLRALSRASVITSTTDLSFIWLRVSRQTLFMGKSSRISVTTAFHYTPSFLHIETPSKNDVTMVLHICSRMSRFLQNKIHYLRSF